MTKRNLSEDAYLLMLPRLLALGEDVLALVRTWGEQAEKNPPSLENFDAFGRRIDRLHLPQGWHKLKRFSVQNRLVALGYDRNCAKLVDRLK